MLLGQGDAALPGMGEPRLIAPWPDRVRVVTVAEGQRTADAQALDHAAQGGRRGVRGGHDERDLFARRHDGLFLAPADAARRDRPELLKVGLQGLHFAGKLRFAEADRGLRRGAVGLVVSTVIWFSAACSR
jgi:hypothetical protein